LDKYLNDSKQAPGRELVERQHIQANSDDMMVVQRIRERLTAPDGTSLDTMQYQFLVIRFGALHLFLA